MFDKTYHIENVKQVAGGREWHVYVRYEASQSGQPANSTVTGVAASSGGSFISATSQNPNDTTTFRDVDLQFDGPPTIDVSYCKNSTAIERD